MISLTKRDIEEAKQTIWSKMCSGESDDDIIDALGVETTTYTALKLQMLDDKAAELRTKPPEHVYVEYIINQEQNISDLTEMIGEFKKTKQYNAMVGAIRARADLYDKLIAKGQEFGVFRKTPERREIVAGLLVSDMTSHDLKTAITKAIGNLEAMTRRYGDNDILDVEVDSLHYGPALPPKAMEEESVVAPKAKSKSNGKGKSKHQRSKTSRNSRASRGRKPFPK